jgi:hypothetical protein
LHFGLATNGTTASSMPAYSGGDATPARAKNSVALALLVSFA